MRLENKVAIITGAGSGIGAESARRFVEEGANVLIADMQDDKGQAVADELGDAAQFLHVDVSQEQHVEAAVAEAVTTWGKLDIMFNNAGFGGALGSIETTTVDDFDITFDVLVKGVFLGFKHAIPAMRAAGGGAIINTASVAGLQAGYSPHLYSVAKSAVIHLTKSVALEVGQDNIGHPSDQVSGSRSWSGQHPVQLHLPWHHRHSPGGGPSQDHRRTTRQAQTRPGQDPSAWAYW